MGDKTKIEWTDATWNPVTGCTKVSAGCKFCYAEREFPRIYRGRDFTDVRVHPNRLDQPLRWKRPRKIFVNSMSDLFHESVRFDFIADVLAVMAVSQQHIFQILTKRPERMAKFFNWCPNMPPFDSTIEHEIMRRTALLYGRGQAELRKWAGWPLPNVWLGVSVENQETAVERIPVLLQTRAAIRFVSYEPALGRVDFERFLLPAFATDDERYSRPLDWLIGGGESGPRARPSHPDWFRSARDQCQAAGVPFFFKHWGAWSPAQGLCQGPPSKCRWVFSDGTWSDESSDLTSARMARTGKKRAGRLLDGREWNEFPKG